MISTAPVVAILEELLQIVAPSTWLAGRRVPLILDQVVDGDGDLIWYFRRYMSSMLVR